MKRKQDFFRGCLVGGAIGDALGWPVEFLSFDEIVDRYGTGGIQDLLISSSGKAEISDDTQMTLFTAEGLLRAQTRGHLKGICHEPTVVFHAYQRWLLTQGYPRKKELEWIYDGWLLEHKELFVRRAPGNSCLSALNSSSQSGGRSTIEKPINQSKGCGGVMRVAPVGLMYPKEKAFGLAAEIAALTHGHPSGYLSAGALAYLIALIIEGYDLAMAVTDTVQELKKYDGYEECRQALNRAVQYSTSSNLDAETIHQIGEGWTGEEALAIAVYCALKHKDSFQTALLASVNHKGDSDSTGAITGNILGAYLGIGRIPAPWVKSMELLDVLVQIADDLIVEYNEENVNWSRYPGY